MSVGVGDEPSPRLRVEVILENHGGRGLVEPCLAGAPVSFAHGQATTDVDRTLEREANVFGAELLMPEAAVRETWAAFADRDELASRFGVSALAAQWRLYSFGLVDDRPG